MELGSNPIWAAICSNNSAEGSNCFGLAGDIKGILFPYWLVFVGILVDFTPKVNQEMQMNRRQVLIGTGGLTGLLACQQQVNYSSGAEARLAELGITLPVAPKPVANYVPWRKVGSLLWVAGQGPAFDSPFATGILGADLTVEQGKTAARNAGLNVLAQVRQAAGSLDLVRKCLKIGGFVHCTDHFTQQPQVINGASDLMVEVFGDAGKAARYAVGSNALPFHVSVEIESVWELA
jgi:enamine deaminase RidA (YjgF/YER057c/UK114 family)